MIFGKPIYYIQHRQSMQQEIELQISINVGAQKYLIKVPKRADLPELVRNFLSANKLNLKHQAAIVSMVQAKVKEEEEKRASIQEDIREEGQAEEQEESQEEGVSSRVTAGQQSQEQAVRSNIKQGILQKLKEEIQSCKINPPDSRMVYEQWKLREKYKSKKQNHPLTSNEQSRLTKATRETLSPDHFYKKGKEFQQTCHVKTQHQFKKLYPFKLHDKQMKEEEQSQLCDRLCKHRKEKNVKDFLSGLGEMEKGKARPKYDEVKMRVKQFDDEVDRMLFGMIRDGEISYAKIRPKSKSPFRKTVLH